MTDRQPRPVIQSTGNSLTSISALTTLPPSPIPQLPISRSAHVHPTSANRPTEIDVNPLGFSDITEVAVERQLSPPGSVPSPKPRFAHLHASAPLRPRLPRAPSYTRTRVPSPLNPASQHLRPVAVHFDPNPIDGSVPNPKPNRLFTSLYYHPLSPPNTTRPNLPQDHELTNRCPPRLRNGQKGSAPRKISPSGVDPARSAPSFTPDSFPDPGMESSESFEKSETESPAVRAPSSFSTFVASIDSLRRNSLIPSSIEGLPTEAKGLGGSDIEDFDKKRVRFSQPSYAHE